MDKVNYHQKTLELLKESNVNLSPQPIKTLCKWAKENNINLPPAYLEWASLDPNCDVLSKYSNTDDFSWNNFNWLPDERHALSFHTESQGNFKSACLLNAGDNPPVIFIWCDDKFIQCSKSFSDYILCQIFDWQHRFLFDENGKVLDLDYTGINLEQSNTGTYLSAHYEEYPSSSYIIDNRKYQTRRFRHETGVRISSSSWETSNTTYLELTGADKKSIAQVEANLLKRFNTSLIPRSFFCPHHPKSLFWCLDNYVKHNLRTQIKYMSNQPMTEEIINAVISASQEKPLSTRIKERILKTREPPESEWFGGHDWGVKFKLVKLERAYLMIETVELA